MLRWRKEGEARPGKRRERTVSTEANCGSGLVLVMTEALACLLRHDCLLHSREAGVYLWSRGYPHQDKTVENRDKLVVTEDKNKWSRADRNTCSH